MRKPFIVLSLCAALCLSGCASSAHTPFTSTGYQSMQYNVAVDELTKSGFTNIETIATETAIENDADRVYSISIDGKSSFISAERYDADALVTVCYYVYIAPTPAPTATPEPSVEQVTTATRDAALAANTQFIACRSTAAEAYYTFLASVKGNAYGTEVEAYNAAKELSEQLQACYSDAMAIEADTELEYFDDYRLSNYTYISNMIEAAKKSMQYFDDGKTSTLSDFQSAVQGVETTYVECYTLQDAFLSSAGFSYDEIDEMLENLEEENTD